MDFPKGTVLFLTTLRVREFHAPKLSGKAAIQGQRSTDNHVDTAADRVLRLGGHKTSCAQKTCG